MSEERYLEICKMSMPEYHGLSAKEKHDFMAYPMTDQQRGEIMEEIRQRAEPLPPSDHKGL